MHAEARIQEQVVYLGDDSRNQQLGKREREMQEGRQPIKGACQPSYYYERLELSTPGELWEIVWGGHASRISAEGEEAGILIYQLPSIWDS